VIIDIAYRLYPEVQIPEMLHDVQRAIAFTRLNAARLGIDPQRIVLGGASAGGHLSLLAAYAPHHPELLAPELAGHDLAVRAVFSYYGPCDLAACYRHTNQQDPGRARPAPAAGLATSAAGRRSA
jgi:acetyl esterase/lipase